MSGRGRAARSASGARTPPLLGEALRGALERCAWSEPLRGWGAVDAWPEVVGARIAARTRAVEYRDGRLLVEVDGATWLAELTLLSRQILARLTAAVGTESAPCPVKEIRFVPARGSAAPSA